MWVKEMLNVLRKRNEYRSLTVNINDMNAIVIIDGAGAHPNRGTTDLARKLYQAKMLAGATRMIEALKADRLVPDDIDKVAAADEAIRRYTDPMSSPKPIVDMKED